MRPLIAVLLLLGCAKQPPPKCEGEPTDVQRDTRARITTLAAAADPSAGGRLKGAPEVGPRKMRAVLLLDYSGSMWAGYDKPAQPTCAMCKGNGTKRNGQPYLYATTEYRVFLAQLVDATTPQNTDVAMRALLFNKHLWSFDGGKVARVEGPITFPWNLASMTSVDLARAMADIPADPFKATGQAADETHLKPALEAAVDAVLSGGHEGIIWVVTDNIADQTGGGVSADDARRNLEFYNFLASDPRLQLVYAYPMHDTATCTWLCGGALFAYGIHVSTKERAGVDEANRISGGHLGDGAPTPDGLLWNDKLREVTSGHAGRADTNIAGVPLRLKPMDLNAVSVSFKTDDKGKAVPVKCKRTAEFGEAIPCLASVVVKNNLRHERVDSAVLTFENGVLAPHTKESTKKLQWASSVCAGKVQTKRTLKGKVDDDNKFPIGPLNPGQSQALDVILMMPPVQVAPTSVGQIFDVAFTDVLLLEGPLTARVDNVQTSLVVPPDQRQRVYGAANLPQIFVARNQSEVRASFPAIVPVNNDGKLQALLLIVGLGAGLLLLLLFVFRFQSAFCTVLVDGVEVDRLRLFRFSSQRVENKGVRMGRVKRGVGLPTFVPEKGSTAKRQGSAWIVSPPGGGGLEQRVELRQGWRSKAKAETASGGF